MWLPEATRGTYPALTNMFYFGEVKQDLSLPATIPGGIQINKIETMGTRTAAFSKGPAFHDSLSTSYIAVNGLPLYWMIGNSVNAGGDTTHTLTPLPITAKPSISLFREGIAATEKRKAAGNVATALDLRYTIGSQLDINETFVSMTDAVSADTPAGSTFPSSVTSAFDVLSTFTINAVPYSLSEIGISLAQVLKPYGNNGGHYRGITDTRSIYCSMVANLQGDMTALRTLRDNGTPHTVIWKIVKSVDPTKYIQLTTTMSIFDIADQFNIGDPTDYGVVSAIGSNPSAVVLDGVADTFYPDLTP